ncbi:SDR family oxidoreductase, partial [Streptomyces alkaliterrae]
MSTASPSAAPLAPPAGRADETPRRIMVLGAGDLGRRAFHELAHSHRPRDLQLVGRDEDTVVRATNLTRFCAAQRGYTPTVGHALTDLTDVARTAERIAAFRPDILFLAASYQSWWVISTLEQAAFRRLYAANYGPWLPMHLVPVMKAMEAVRFSGVEPLVVNAAYPDAVHPVLHTVGLSPHLGIGNVANNVPGITAAVADELRRPTREVEVRLVAHHYVSHRLSRHGDSGPAEMGLGVRVDGRDVTDELDLPALLARLPERYRRTGGLPGQAMTAASALSVLEPLADGRDALVHAPGTLGATGGHPVALRSGEPRIDLPDGMTAEQAHAINLSGQVQDGITEIRPDGTVVFEPASMAVMTAELGYECAEMKLSDAEDRAREISDRFAAHRTRTTPTP